MAWQLPIGVPLQFLAVLASLLVAGIAWRHRDQRGSRALAVLMLATAWWSLTYVIGLGTTGRGLKILAYNLAFPAIAVVPVAWLMFALQYTGRLRPPTRRELGAVLVVPALAVVLAWTNPSHGLMRASVDLVSRESFVFLSTTGGPAFWVFTLYSYLLIAVGTGLLLTTAVLSPQVYRDQALVLGVAAVLPWGANVLYFLGLTGNWDPTSPVFALSGTVLMGAIYRRHLLQLAPVTREIARDELVGSMAEAVIVVDESGRIADCNPAAADLAAGSDPPEIGAQFADAFPTIAAAIDLAADSGERVELTTAASGTERRYEVQSVSLQRGYGTITSHLLTVRDITDRYEREQQLQRYGQRLEVLNRVLRHDIRNGMNIILGTATQCATDHPEVAGKLEPVERKGREILALSEKAREAEAVMQDTPLQTTPVDVVPVVERVVDALAADYPAAEIRTDLPGEAVVSGTDSLDAAVREVLENAIEHDDSPEPVVDVAVETGPQEAVVAVDDEGPGLPQQERQVLERGEESALTHSSGLGLWLVTWIVASAGGEIGLGSPDDSGTTVRLHLPLADQASSGRPAETGST